MTRGKSLPNLFETAIAFVGTPARAYCVVFGGLIIVSVGLISLYFIPRQQIVLPAAEESIRVKSSSDHIQEKNISAMRANFILSRSFSSTLPIISCRRTALAAWQRRNITGTATKKGRCLSEIIAA